MATPIINNLAQECACGAPTGHVHSGDCGVAANIRQRRLDGDGCPECGSKFSVPHNDGCPVYLHWREHGWKRPENGWDNRSPAEALPIPPNGTRAGDRLRGLGALYDRKNAEYGDSYKSFGPFASSLFPDGLKIDSPADFGRMMVFLQIVGKVHRYAANFHNGGHGDSLDDIAVYAQMLRELDNGL